MRRMYSEAELKASIKKYIRENGDDVVASLVGKDLSIEGLTSKGIANTGGFANIGDVAISGDLNVQGEGKGKITANTLEQRQANLKITDFTPTLSAHGTTAGLVLTALFNEVAVINGVLYIIAMNKITNPTESQISVTYQDYIEYDITLPEDIAEKIKDFDDKSVKESSTANISVSFKGSANAGSSYYELLSRLQNLSTANKMKVRYQPNASINLAPGASLVYEDRIFLVIL